MKQDEFLKKIQKIQGYMYKKCMDKPVKLMIIIIIIGRTHAPLQLLLLRITMPTKKTCKDADGDHNYLWSNNTELQWCIHVGVANNYTCYLQLYKLVPVLFIPVQLCTFLMF